MPAISLNCSACDPLNTVIFRDQHPSTPKIRVSPAAMQNPVFTITTTLFFIVFLLGHYGHSSILIEECLSAHC